MEGHVHSMSNLFIQLGLPEDPGAFQAFIASHRPLDPHIALYDAPFWTTTQAQFLRECLEDDADWAVIIDKLDSGLRQTLG